MTPSLRILPSAGTGFEKHDSPEEHSSQSSPLDPLHARVPIKGRKIGFSVFQGMRIRTVKPEFFTHEGLFDLERECKMPVRVAFAGLWCAADREGRFKWEPRRLGVSILPYDNLDFGKVLDALASKGFIRKYSVGGGTFGCIPTFLKHQVVNNRERDSDLPEPTDSEHVDACATRAPRVNDASEVEGKGREHGKERNTEADSGVSERGLKFAEWFRGTLSESVRLSSGWKTSFAKCFDDLIRLDKRTEKEISDVCKWARRDDFWASNFLTPLKLRQKKDGVMYFDIFAEKMKAPPRSNGNGHAEPSAPKGDPAGWREFLAAKDRPYKPMPLESGWLRAEFEALQKGGKA